MRRLARETLTIICHYDTHIIAQWDYINTHTVPLKWCLYQALWGPCVNTRNSDKPPHNAGVEICVNWQTSTEVLRKTWKGKGKCVLINSIADIACLRQRFIQQWEKQILSDNIRVNSILTYFAGAENGLPESIVSDQFTLWPCYSETIRFRVTWPIWGKSTTA